MFNVKVVNFFSLTIGWKTLEWDSKLFLSKEVTKKICQMIV